MKKIKREGFTLFELLVSISIIGILTAIAAISFGSAQKKSRDARRFEDMGLIQKAAEQYYSMSNYVYPAGTNAPTQWTFNGQAVLETFPRDPKGTGWTGYIYNIGTTYCACAAMENRANGNSNGICALGTGVTGAYYCVKSQQ